MMIPTYDIEPLEALLGTMRTYQHQSEIDKAVAIARAAASYVHPRAGRGKHATHIELDIGHLSDAEIASRIAAAQTRIEASEFDPNKFT